MNYDREHCREAQEAIRILSKRSNLDVPNRDDQLALLRNRLDATCRPPAANRHVPPGK